MAHENLSDLLRSLPGGSGAFGPMPALQLPHQHDPKYLAAENLVEKATSRLHDGDESRARRSVAQAAGLGWFDLEEVPYGVFVAQMVLFDEIVDSLETADPSEWAWRDACLALLANADDLEAAVLRDPLSSILQDYDLPKQQVRELRRAIGDADGTSLFGLNPQSSVEQVTAVLWAMVSLTTRLHERLHH
ncbi:MAG: hypothetical protein L0H96_14095 [Humibacillus sp.]|nr:hypothetical protein [Humibacillus sp.]MDN5778029.1 hypothetical protein [Humibacillus sp.]